MITNLLFSVSFLAASFILSRLVELAETRRLQAIRIRATCAEIRARR